MSTPTAVSVHNQANPLSITINVIIMSFLVVCAAVSTLIAGISIQGELALSNTQSIWLTTINFLGSNIAVPISDTIAKRFGMRLTYFYSILLFSLATLITAAALDFPVLIVGRLIQGIAAGLIFAVGLSLIVVNVPKTYLMLGVNSYFAAAFGLGIGVGLPLAGYLAQFYSWRALFFLMVPISIALAIMAWPPSHKLPPKSNAAFDIWGFVTFSLFICSLLIALTFGPIQATDEGWRSPFILFFFLSALLSLILCILIEKKHPNPLLPLKLFKDPLFSLGLIAMFLLGMATFASIAVSTEYMMTGLRYEKYIAGIMAGFYGVVIAVMGFIANILSKKIPIPLLMFVGLGCLAWSYFLNNELSWLTGYVQVLWILLIRGIGVGFALGPTTAISVYLAPQELKTAAAMLVTFFRQVGGTYGSTLISIFSIRQTIFHTARYSEQTNTQLPAYQNTFWNLYHKFPDAARAKAAIVQNLKTQAFIQGLNDALIAFAYITTAVTLLLFAILSFRYLRSQYLKRSR